MAGSSGASHRSRESRRCSRLLSPVAGRLGQEAESGRGAGVPRVDDGSPGDDVVQCAAVAVDEDRQDADPEKDHAEGQARGCEAAPVRSRRRPRPWSRLRGRRWPCRAFAPKQRPDTRSRRAATVARATPDADGRVRQRHVVTCDRRRARTRRRRPPSAKSACGDRNVDAEGARPL